MFLVFLTIREAKEKGRVRIEVEVATLTEGVTTMVTIRVTRRLPTRDLLDKVIIIQVAKGVRVIANLPNILTKTNRGDTTSSTKIDSRVEMIKGAQAIVGAITAALGEAMQTPQGVGTGNVSAVMGPLTISMGSAIGRITALQN